MLRNLIDTKLKKKLLNIFLSFPERGFYVEELRDLVRTSASQINKTMRDLIDRSVVIVKTKRRKRYFQFNPRYEHTEQLEGLIDLKRLSQSPAEKILLRLKKDVEAVLLGGVLVFRPEQEVDLLIVEKNKTSLSRSRLDRVVKDLEALIGQELNYSVMDLDEFEQRFMVRDRFLRDILDRPHLVVVNNLKKAKQRLLGE